MTLEDELRAHYEAVETDDDAQVRLELAAARLASDGVGPSRSGRFRGRLAIAVTAVVVAVVALAVSLTTFNGRGRGPAGGATAPSDPTAQQAARACHAAVNDAASFGKHVSLAAAFTVTGDELRRYVTATTGAYGFKAGDVASATRASICILDGSFDPELPLAPGAPERTYTRVSMLIINRNGPRLFQVGSPRTMPASLPFSTDAPSPTRTPS